MSSAPVDHPKPAAAAAEQPAEKKQKVASDAAATTPTTYTLYSYWRSGASWRVRICLALKNLSYELRTVNLLTSEQRSESYARLNPQRKLPFLALGDEGNRGLSQSLAIIDYLDRAHPETVQLLPKDPYLRAKAWSLAEGINADTQPLQNLPCLERVAEVTGGGETGAAARAAWGKWAVTNGMRAFEEGIKEIAGKCCVGDEITIADLCLIPQLSAARRFGIDLSAYPTCLRIDKELSTHPAFIAGHANTQPDKPKDMAPID